MFVLQPNGEFKRSFKLYARGEPPEKKGRCGANFKKGALLGSFDSPWRAEGNWLSVVFHFKIFFGENLNPKVHDLDVY